MQQQKMPISRLYLPAVLIGVAALMYALLLTTTVFAAVVTGTLFSAVALAVIGAAVYKLTIRRLVAPDTARLGARAQATWRSQRTLAIGTALTVFAALVLGTLATNTGALWSCTSWPLCTPADGLGVLALVHRGMAALATVLVALLAWQTLRSRDQQVARLAAGWSFGLLLLQNGLGLVQVALAAVGSAMPVTAARVAHLAVGAFGWAVLVVLATAVVRLAPSKRVLETPVAEAAVKQPSLLKDYVSLTKPGVISLLIFTTFAAMFITPAGLPSFWLVFWTMVGGWLMPAGAHALNCYFDRDIDELMGRTGRRPIPSGRIPAWHALALGLVLGALAFVILAVFVNMVTALLALAGFIYYVVFYTMILKRSTTQNIVIGGGAGAFPPLVGWAAVTGNLSLASLLLFMIIFYWTPPHFWALALIRQKDYANAGVPMLPVIAGDAETKKQILLYTLLMIVLTVLPTPLGMFGLAYLVMALALGAWFLYYVIAMLRADSTPARWALYRFSLLYLFLLFIAMLIDRLVFA